MEKCKNIEEIAQKFDSQKALTIVESAFYVSIYDDQIRELQQKILINKIETKTFYICGQLGNGKSTALAFVPNQKLEDRNSFLYIDCLTLVQENDTDIVDVLLFIGLKVAEKGGFLDDYFEELNKLKDINLGKLEQVKEIKKDFSENAGTDIKTGIKQSFFGVFFNAQLFAGYKINKNDRESVRKIFYIDKTELRKLINSIIHRYEEDVSRSEKQLFLIVDELEKISKTEDIENIFFINASLLESLECPKIITMPIFAIRDYSTANKPDLLNLTTRVTSNPLIGTHADTVVSDNIQKLKDVVLRRIENGLIDDSAIELAVKMSGGNLRQLINIIYQAAINASVLESGVIRVQHIEKAVQNLKNNLAMSATNRIKILAQVNEKYKQFNEPKDDDQMSLNRCIRENLVFSYHNGFPWYEVNPIIQDTVKIYSQS